MVVIQKARSWGLLFRKDFGKWGLLNSGERTKHEPEKDGERMAGGAVVLQKARSGNCRLEKILVSGDGAEGITRTRKGWRENGVEGMKHEQERGDGVE